LATWDSKNVEGNLAVPLFGGLKAVVKALASKMPIHALETGANNGQPVAYPT